MPQRSSFKRTDIGMQRRLWAKSNSNRNTVPSVTEALLSFQSGPRRAGIGENGGDLGPARPQFVPALSWRPTDSTEFERVFADRLGDGVSTDAEAAADDRAGIGTVTSRPAREDLQPRASLERLRQEAHGPLSRHKYGLG